MFLITIFCPRGGVEYEDLIGLSYNAKYLAYVQYVLLGFVHFFSLYVFGMFCSKHKEIIDKFYSKRALIFGGMVLTAAGDIYLTHKGIYSNFTISKTFLTMLLLGYLKHYDEYLISHEKLNKVLDFIAKYSFGLFFIHWYWIFIYNQIFHLQNVYIGPHSLLIVSARFLAVTLLSLGTLYILKTILEKFGKNTRMFLGV